MKGPEAKQKLRHEMRARLRNLNLRLHADLSQVICHHAAQLPAFAIARTVALFAPLPGEPAIGPLVELAWGQGRRVVLPRMGIENGAPYLHWHAVAAWDQLIEMGPFGLREPSEATCPQVAASELDCAFIPGLSFDEDGFRLGRGGGYYDAFLSRASPQLPCIGLMFSLQKVAQVPRERHDQRLPMVVTELGPRRFS